MDTEVGHRAQAQAARAPRIVLSRHPKRIDWFIVPVEWLPEVAGAPSAQIDPRHGPVIHRSHLPLLLPHHPEAADLMCELGSLVRSERAAFDSATDPLGWKLRSYQHDGREFIINRRGTLLADGMRTGKTATTVASHDPASGPLLVAAPLSVREVWLTWFKRRWPDKRPVVLTGRTVKYIDPAKPRKARKDPGYAILEGERLDPAALASAELVFCNYDILAGWQNFGNRHIGTLVLDEAHVLAKKSTRRSKAAMFLAPTAERVIAATGTPLWNKPVGLWPILACICPGAFGKFYEFASRYCLRGSTKILRHDGTYAPIDSLRVGDTVMGWSYAKRQRIVLPTRVTGCWQRQAECFRVRLASGREVVCTPDHHWLAAALKPSPKQYRPLFGEKTGRKWRRPLRHLFVVAPAPSEHVENAAYKLGYLRGLLDGDGCTRASTQGYACIINAKEVEHLQVAYAYALDLDMRPIVPRLQKDGMWRLGLYYKVDHAVLTSARASDPDFRRGWLAGIWDAEGTDFVIAQYEAVNHDVCEYIAECLTQFSFRYTRLAKAINILGGRREVLRFVGLVRPKLRRKIDHIWTDNGYDDDGSAVFDMDAGYKMGRPVADRIVSVEPTGLVETVYAIKTETGNYIAEGYGSKNCNGHMGAYGFEAEGVSNEAEFRMRMQEVMIRRTWQDVAAELPPIERSVEVVSLTEEQGYQIEVDAERVRDHSRRANLVGALARLRRVLAKLKIGGAIDASLRVLESGERVVVWTWHRDIAYQIEDALAKAGFPGLVVTGATDADKRDAILERWRQSDPSPLVITMSVGQVGIDLSAARQAVFAELDFTPSVVAQAEMRVFSASHPTAVTYVIVDHDVDRRILDALQTKCEAASRLGVPAAETAIDVLARAFEMNGGAGDDMQALAAAALADHPDDLDESDDYHGALWDTDLEEA